MSLFSKLPLSVFSASGFWIVFLLFISLVISLPFVEYDDPRVREKFSQYNCYKHRICTPGPPKVCAFDRAILDMDIFEDKCAVYKANCEMKLYYKIINMTNCESKQMFQEHFNDTLQFEHVNRSYIRNFETTTELPDTTEYWNFFPSVVKLVNKFYKYVLSF